MEAFLALKLLTFNDLPVSFWFVQYQFLFDEAFHEGCSNEEVYKRTAQPLIKTIFNRYSISLFLVT